MDYIFDLLERARVLMNLKRYADAEKKLSEAMAFDPVNIEVLLLLCRCKLMLNKIQESGTLAQGVLARDPSNDQALSLLAEVYAALGETGMAEVTIREAMTWDASNVNYMAQLSRYLVMLRDEPAAVQFAVDALKIDPNHVPSLAALGWAHAALDNYEESLAAFRRGLSIDPNNVVLLHHIGSVFSETGEVDKAKAIFLDALRNDPNFDDVAINVAGLQYRNTFLYRIHYKLVYLFRDSHISRINFFTGAFLFLQSIAEPAWKDYTIWAKLSLAPAWIFLLIMLSVFIVPTAGNLPAIFTSTYKHLFSSKVKLRTIIIFLLYLGSVGLLAIALLSSGLTARGFMYASLIVLTACPGVHAILGTNLTVGAMVAMLFIALCLYTWLYLTAKGIIHYGGFYGVCIVFSTTLIGLVLSVFKKFKD